MKKRLLSSLMAFIMCLSLLPTGAFAASADVVINETNFPDANFRTYVKTLPGADDGTLTTEELVAITTISCGASGINSLKGIEHFTALKDLNVSRNNLTELDLSAMPNLVSLVCSNNELKKLDLSHTPKLTHLDCSNNNLTSLKLAGTEVSWDYRCNQNSLVVPNQEDISVLTVNGFDLSKVVAGSVTGGRFEGGKIVFNEDSDKILYTYDMEKTGTEYGYPYQSPQFTLYKGSMDANGTVTINRSSFPDPAFRNFVKERIDGNHDGRLSESERNDTTYGVIEMDVSGLGIENLKGIEYFQNMVYLHCEHNNLTSLDLSQNQNLVYVYCSNNELKTLAIPDNLTDLKILDCSFNHLESITGSNSNLKALYCSNNRLTELDAGKFPGLTYLNVDDNQLTSLTPVATLTDLRCENNALTALDVSSLPALNGLYCGGNQLEALYVGENTALTHLRCSRNKLTSLDLSKNTALTWLLCSGNRMAYLDLTANDKLGTVIVGGSVYDTQTTNTSGAVDLSTISGMDVSNIVPGSVRGGTLSEQTLTVTGGQASYDYKCREGITATFAIKAPKSAYAQDTVDITPANFPDPEFLAAIQHVDKVNGHNDGKLTPSDTIDNGLNLYGLDITDLTGLEKIRWLTSLHMGNIARLQSVDLSNLRDLEVLDARFCSNLKSLDLSKNTKLKSIDIRNTSITSLDITMLTALESLICSKEHYDPQKAITSLDLRNNPNLKLLDCSYNGLTTLDVSKNPQLTTLKCSYNQIRELDVRRNPLLERLFCSDNQLTGVDVTGLENLEALNVGSNNLGKLDVSHNLNLKQLRCSDCGLTELDLRNNRKLGERWSNPPYQDSIGELLIENSTGIEEQRNRITSLQLPNSPALRNLTTRGIAFGAYTPSSLETAFINLDPQCILEHLDRGYYEEVGGTRFRINGFNAPESRLDMTGKSVINSQTFPGFDIGKVQEASLTGCQREGDSLFLTAAAGSYQYDTGGTNHVMLSVSFTGGTVHEHTYGAPAYAWTDDHDGCKARHVCSSCGKVEEVSAASVGETVIKAPAYQVEGESTFTAVFAEAWAGSPSVTVTTPALEKQSADVTANNKTVTVTYGEALTPDKWFTASNKEAEDGSWTYAYQQNGAGITVPENVGTYTVTGTYEDNTHIGSDTLTLTIRAAKQNLSANAANLDTQVNGIIDAAALKANIAGAKGELTFTITEGDAGSISEKGFTATKEGKVTVKAAAAAKDVNGDGIPEYAADPDGVTFTVTVGAIPVGSPVNVTGVIAPEKGAVPAASVTAPAHTTASIAWSPELADGMFKPNTAYTAVVTLTPEENYDFSQDAVFQLDGSVPDSVTTGTGRAKVLTKTFEATDPGFIVVFKEKDGTVLATRIVDAGAGIADAPVPAALTGYTFNGWGKEIEKVTQDLTLTAAYTPVSYQISYDLAEGIAGTPANPESYTIESDDITLTNPTREHYTFAGWTLPGLSQPTQTVTIAKGSTGERNYTAVWTPVAGTATVIFKVENGIWSDGSTSKTVTVNTSAGFGTLLPSQIPTGTANAGYLASGSWDTQPNTADNAMAQDQTYTYTCTYTAKAQENLAVTLDNWTYGEAAKTPQFTDPGGTKQIRYEGVSPTVYPSSETAPTDAGNYKVTLSCETGETVYTGNALFTVEKRPLTVTANAQEITYGTNIADGTTEVTVSGLTPLAAGDTLTGITLTASSDQVAAENKVVTPSEAVVTGASGDMSDNYAVTYETGVLTITRSTPEIVFNGYAPGRVYHNGSALALPASSQLTLTGCKFENVKFAWYKNSVAEENLLQAAPENVGNYVLKAFVEETANTNAASAVQTGIEITPASYGPVTKTILITKNRTQVQTDTFTAAAFFETMPSGAVITNVSATSGNLLSGIAVNEGTMTYTSRTGLANEANDSFTVTITTDNYLPISATLNFELTDKAPTEVTISGIPQTVTYGDQPFTLTAVAAQPGEGEGSWTWTSSQPDVLSVTDGAVTIHKVGTATITAAYESETTKGEKATAQITVGQAKVTVTATNRSIYLNGAVPELTAPAENTDYTVTGLVGEDTLGGTITMKYQKDGQDATPDNQTVGSYAIVIEGATVGNNYTLEFVPGTLSITGRPSSGGGSSRPSDPTVDKEETKTDEGVKTTETKKDGTVVETMKGNDGSVTETTRKPDGSSVTEAKTADGTTATTSTDAEGKTVAQVKVSQKAVEEAAKADMPVELPVVDVKPTNDPKTAPQVKVSTGSKESVKVTVPVVNQTSGTAVIIVHPDGTEEIVRKTANGENGITLAVKDGTTLKIVNNTKQFNDVTDKDWYRNAVDFATSHELFAGVGGGSFAPNASMTRGMLAQVLYNLEGKPDTTASEEFNDVSDKEWYAKSVCWAADKGIVSGYGDGRFGPNDRITREQLAVMLWNYAGKPAVEDGELHFADAGQVSSYAQNAIQWAVRSGIMSGDGINLNPLGYATRAEVAAMLMNFVNNFYG